MGFEQVCCTYAGPRGGSLSRDMMCADRDEAQHPSRYAIPINFAMRILTTEGDERCGGAVRAIIDAQSLLQSGDRCVLGVSSGEEVVVEEVEI